MYEEHKVKCASCGKEFLSEMNRTMCNECFDAANNKVEATDE